MAAARIAATDTLDIAYEITGVSGGPVVILLHGFPDDVRTWDDVLGPLAAAGFLTRGAGQNRRAVTRLLP